MKKYNKVLIILIFITGIILRLIYINSTSIYDNQYDFEVKDGHFDYIKLIYEQNKLPDTNENQYYHPPLHHFICSIWLKFFNSYESLQCLTCIYSILLMYFQYSIVRKFDLKFIYEIIILLVIVFWPRMIILSGSLNNDLLTYLLIIISLNFLIDWYKNTNYKNTVFLALFTGLSVMTKMLGSLLTGPIIYIFVIKMNEYIKSKKFKTFIKYIFVFFIISLLLALWYPIRNYILFNQKIFYVLDPKIIEMKVNSNLLKSIFILDFKELFTIWNNAYINRNIFSYIIKSSLWGEFYFYNGINYLFLQEALIINVILFLCSIYSILREIICSNIKDDKNNVEKNILVIFIALNIISIFLNGLRLPYMVSFDFRYLILYLFVAILFIIFRINKIKNEKIRKIVTIALVCSLLYIIIITNIEILIRN